jgi:hypothetical protein
VASLVGWHATWKASLRRLEIIRIRHNIFWFCIENSMLTFGIMTCYRLNGGRMLHIVWVHANFALRQAPLWKSLKSLASEGSFRVRVVA